ncbi:hypothetical protein [Mesorhizobium sp. 128a]
MPSLAKAGERRAIFQTARDIIEIDLMQPAAIAHMPAMLKVSNMRSMKPSASAPKPIARSAG